MRLAPRLLALFSMVCSAHGASLIAAGPPRVLLDNAQRLALGMQVGPDTPADFFQGRNGEFYLNTAGALGPGHGQTRQAAWDMHMDSQLTQVLAWHGTGPATGPGDVQVILTDHAAQCGARNDRVARGAQGGAACAAYFDRDYAGGGTYFRCPNGGPSVYFYHGENHTAPDGSHGDGGWFGIGVGYFNRDETALTPARALSLPGGGTSSQIIGLNLPTIWRGAAPPQDRPYIGAASVVSPGDGYVYLYHGDTSQDAETGAMCRPECSSVSRAPLAAFCATIASAAPVAWHNYYQGGWAPPAVLGADSALGLGAGGPFTPLATEKPRGEHGGGVTYLPARHLYVMPRSVGGGVDIHYATDGLHWSAAQMLVPAPSAPTPAGDVAVIMYPRVNVTGAGQAERYVLTYSLVTKGHFWKWAEFLIQPLTLSN